MKIYILVAIVVICVGCRKDAYLILDNKILIKKNYTEQLIFLDIESNTFFQEAFFQVSLADTTKMQSLDDQKMQQVVDIISDVWDERFQRKTDSMKSELPPILEDTITWQIFFVCGRIDIHPDLTSLVIFGADSIANWLESKEFWLLNLKGNELRSIVRLSSHDTAGQNFKEGTIYNNRQFTYIDESIVIDSSCERNYLMQKLFYKSLVYCARYQIDENGFIQIIDNPVRP
jgi:hypothetical protein